MNREIFAGIYDIDGTIVDTKNDAALTMLTGAAAGVVTSDDRVALIQRVWDYATPTGTYRYFDGANYLVSLLFLSGKFRPWI
jgi:oligosaccharide reducing-end xylanase